MKTELIILSINLVHGMKNGNYERVGKYIKEVIRIVNISGCYQIIKQGSYVMAKKIIESEFLMQN